MAPMSPGVNTKRVRILNVQQSGNLFQRLADRFIRDTCRCHDEPSTTVLSVYLGLESLQHSLLKVERRTQPSHSGLTIMTTPSAAMTKPLSSFSQRPCLSCIFRRPSVTTTSQTIMPSSNMYARL